MNWLDQGMLCRTTWATGSNGENLDNLPQQAVKTVFYWLVCSVRITLFLMFLMLLHQP